MIDVLPDELRRAAARLVAELPAASPVRHVGPMPGGPGPSVAGDLDAALRWWDATLSSAVEAVAEVASDLRANADAYEQVDGAVAERLGRALRGTTDGVAATAALTRAPGHGIVDSQ